MITYTVNRLNQITRTSHCLDFLAQAFDVSLDSILFRGVYKRPKVFDDDTATKYPATIAEQKLQEIILFRGQV